MKVAGPRLGAVEKWPITDLIHIGQQILSKGLSSDESESGDSFLPEKSTQLHSTTAGWVREALPHQNDFF